MSRYGLRFTAALLSVLAIIERMARDNNTNKLLNISARYLPISKLALEIFFYFAILWIFFLFRNFMDIFSFINYRLNFNTYYVKQLEKFCSDDKLLEAEKKQSAS